MLLEMKDMMNQVLSVSHVISVIIVLCMGLNSFSQYEENDIISDQEYEIINLFNAPDKGNKIFVYRRTYFDKGWKQYFVKSKMDRIYARVGIPTVVSNDALDSILTEELLEEIRFRITMSKPLELNKNKLNKGVKLVASFDKKSDLQKGVGRISEPIIINDIAVYRDLSYMEAPIFILQRKEGKWEIIYTFNDWLIMH